MRQLHDTTNAQSAQTQMYDMKVSAIEALVAEYKDMVAEAEYHQNAEAWSATGGMQRAADLLLKKWYGFEARELAVFWEEVNSGAGVAGMIGALQSVVASRAYAETINSVIHGGA